MMNESFTSLAGAVFAIFCVLVLAYWSSRFLGKNFAKAASGKNMKVLEQIRIGADKQMILLKLKSQVYLIGVSPAGIQLLSQMEDDFSEEELEIQEETPCFKTIMEQYAKLQHKRKGGDK